MTKKLICLYMKQMLRGYIEDITVHPEGYIELSINDPMSWISHTISSTKGVKDGQP